MKKEETSNISKFVDEILYHVDTIDEQGFSNEKVKESIKDYCKRIKKEDSKELKRKKSLLQ